MEEEVTAPLGFERFVRLPQRRLAEPTHSGSDWRGLLTQGTAQTAHTSAPPSFGWATRYYPGRRGSATSTHVKFLSSAPSLNAMIPLGYSS